MTIFISSTEISPMLTHRTWRVGQVGWGHLENVPSTFRPVQLWSAGAFHVCFQLGCSNNSSDQWSHWRFTRAFWSPFHRSCVPFVGASLSCLNNMIDWLSGWDQCIVWLQGLIRRVSLVPPLFRSSSFIDQLPRPVLNPSFVNFSPSAPNLLFCAAPDDGLHLRPTVFNVGTSARISNRFRRSSANPSVVSRSLSFSMAYEHLTTTCLWCVSFILRFGGTRWWSEPVSTALYTCASQRYICHRLLMQMWSISLKVMPSGACHIFMLKEGLTDTKVAMVAERDQPLTVITQMFRRCKRTKGRLKSISKTIQLRAEITKDDFQVMMRYFGKGIILLAVKLMLLSVVGTVSRCVDLYDFNSYMVGPEAHDYPVAQVSIRWGIQKLVKNLTAVHLI